MNPQFQRALILQQQRRHVDAERELRQVLAQDPHDAPAHALLALSLTEQKRFNDAQFEAGAAIGLEPDLPLAHYAMARVLADRHRFAEAASAIQEAIRLDAYDAGFFGLLAGIRMEQRAWREALEAAEQGLRVDPENVGCTNIRAMALVKLGRRAEAGMTIDMALSRDPDSAITHANQGWTLLHAGEPRKAMEHFREALRLDPELDWARAGIVEAMKARNFFYRWMLLYFLFMNRLRARAQGAIIIGLWVGYQLGRNLADKNPAAGKFIWPLLYLYIAFAVSTWLSVPLFNLMLRLSRFGRLVLSREQTIASNIIGSLLLVALICVILRLTTHAPLYTEAAIVIALLVMPVSGIFACRPGWPRSVMIGVTITLATIGLTALGLEALMYLEPSARLQFVAGLTDRLVMTFVWGILISALSVNWLANVRPTR
jgi:tetratricopeptide (TPR) repeat protein